MAHRKPQRTPHRTPGKPKGTPKTGGRRRGSRNKKLTLAAAKLRELELSAETTVEAIRRGAFYDIGRLFTARGEFRALHTLSEADRSMIGGVEVVMKNAAAGDGKIDRVLKVKFVPRDRYVELAAKVHALLTEKVEHGATDELLARLDRGRLRNAKPAAEEDAEE